MTDVSIIIPTFNRLWCLPEAIASCRSQDCLTEIIVIDDGSTDGTWDWLKEQSDIVALRQPNWGKDNAVNLGFAHAKCEFVRFLDSDDLLPPGVSALQIAEARKTGADVVAAGFIARYERSKSEHITSWTQCDDFIAQQIGECNSSHYSAYLFRRSFLADIRHRQEYAFRDDRMFMIEVAMKEPVVSFLNDPCLIHRHHLQDRIQFQRGMVSQVTYWQELQMFTKVAAWLEAEGKLDQRRKKAVAHVLWPLAHRIAATDVGEACKVVAAIKSLDPEFQIPQKGPLGLLYRSIGFRATQYCVRLARTARDFALDSTGLRQPYSPPPG
jgi:glycosyltransferase involved in cell wall biosynthesis